MLQTTPSGRIYRERPSGTHSELQRKDRRRARRGRGLASGLGWLSIGLGLTELLAPGRVASSIGLCSDRNTRRTLRAMGLREIATGLGILSATRRGPWLWLRVGGDILDMALLGTSMRSRNNDSARISGVLTAVAGITAIDALAARRVAKAERTPGAGAHPRTAIAVTTIHRSPEDVYGFFRDFTNLPRFMAHLESVDVHGDRRSHWKVRIPGGRFVEWDAEILEDRPGELLAWRSLPGADVRNDGVVRFAPAPGGRGTEIHAEIRYRAPAGRIGAAIAKLFGFEPGQQARGDLRRLKQVLETGQVVHSDSSIHRGMHAAQPPTRRFIERHAPQLAPQEIAR